MAFRYYGAKTKLAKKYQKPRYNVILEPFAGSAAYSMHHLERNKSLKAVLVEKDTQVVDAWKWMKEHTPADAINYKMPELGEKCSDFFVRMCATSNASLHSNAMTVNERMLHGFPMQMRRIARLMCVMDRVEVIQGDYLEVCGDMDCEATWFIDPPYQTTSRFAQGMGYGKGCTSSNIDFSVLAEFCRTRRGQTIVCETIGAQWLPFRPLSCTEDSQRKTYTEVVWTNLPDEQMDLFGADMNAWS